MEKIYKRTLTYMLEFGSQRLMGKAKNSDGYVISRG